jgi:hypothetical protein
MATRKPPAIAARFWAKGAAPETAIHVLGGHIVVPGHAKTDRGLVGLVQRAIQKGKARVVLNAR